MKWPRTLCIAVGLGVLAFNAAASVRYVDLNCTNATPPYTDWSIAATNIQDAVDVSSAGDTVLVTNGVYQTGGRVVYGAMTNRVVITNGINLLSLNGPEVTTISGGTPMRCVYVGSNAALSGFTLTNGHTLTSGDLIKEQSGGGVWCAAASGVVSNCLISGNWAQQYGGGGFQGTLFNCVVSNSMAGFGGGGAASNSLFNCVLARNLSFGNTVSGAYGCILSNCLVVGNGGLDLLNRGNGGGASFSSLTSCVVSNNRAGTGGGLYFCVANNSIITSNRAYSSAGGAYGGTLVNCLVNNNIAGNLSNGGNSAGSGGGADSALLNNCVLTGNSAGRGGGAAGSTANNCILYFNYNPPGGSSSNYVVSILNYCCTIPALSGLGNITNEPGFINLAGGDLNLASNSPCINAGNNSYVTIPIDLDGNLRIAGGTVDIGAYEFQSPASIISYAWLQQYGLPMDGSADDLDSDGDGLNNWKEWKAGTIPTNAASVLQLSSPSNSVSGLKVQWQSVSGVTYYLQRSTNLPAFVPVQSNLVGQAGSTTFTDVTATNGGPFFYRIGVQ
jgi:hypothetical protein